MSEEDYYSSDYGPELEPAPNTGVQRDHCKFFKVLDM